MDREYHETIFIISLWFEALVFGLLFCLFLGTLHVNLTLRSTQCGHSRIMFYASILIFIVATVHLAINCHRLVYGFVIHTQKPLAYLEDLSQWHLVAKTSLMITQECLGDTVALYRTWVIWGRIWKPIVIPAMLLIASCVSGYMICGLTATSTNLTVNSAQLRLCVITFNTIEMIQVTLTTGLMAYRIWTVDRKRPRYLKDQGHFLPILRILVESAFLQFVAQAITIVLFTNNMYAWHIMLEARIPLVGITFNAITIRIALHSNQTLDPDLGYISTVYVGSSSDMTHD